MDTFPRIADPPPPRARPARSVPARAAGAPAPRPLPRPACALAGALAGLVVGVAFVAVAPGVGRVVAAPDSSAPLQDAAARRGDAARRSPVSAVLATAIEAGVQPAPDVQGDPP